VERRRGAPDRRQRAARRGAARQRQRARRRRDGGRRRVHERLARRRRLDDPARGAAQGRHRSPRRSPRRSPAATGKGADDVGALDSDDYPSLDPASSSSTPASTTPEGGAQGPQGAAQGLPRRQGRRGGGLGGGGATPKVDKDAEKASDSDLKELQNAKGDDFVKKSKKLKDKVVTGGATPKTDNKKPGGGEGEGR
jgi:hypothetical protein